MPAFALKAAVAIAVTGLAVVGVVGAKAAVERRVAQPVEDLQRLGDVVHVGDDGMHLRLEGEDPATGERGSAGVSISDDGMRMWVDGATADEGLTGAEIGIDDHGMRVRMDAQGNGEDDAHP